MHIISRLKRDPRRLFSEEGIELDCWAIRTPKPSIPLVSRFCQRAPSSTFTQQLCVCRPNSFLVYGQNLCIELMVIPSVQVKLGVLRPLRGGGISAHGSMSTPSRHICGNLFISPGA